MPKRDARKDLRKRSDRAKAFDDFTINAFGAVLLVTSVLATLWLLKAFPAALR